jgi:ATP-dependent DNA helicase PIF1
VPIGPTTHAWTVKGNQCTRTQFPLSIAYAITVHKSQGLSLDQLVIGLGKADFARGLSFVSISRGKTLGGLAFAGPVTKARLTRTIDSRNRAREDAHRADAQRRAQLTLPAPSAAALAWMTETFFV